MFASVIPLPQELNEICQQTALANEKLMLSQQYEKARTGFEQMYNLLLKAQPKEGRYHKGYSLHNIGMTFLLAGNPVAGLKYFMLAYAEDLLSEETGKEDEADNMPAGRNLRSVYGVGEDVLVELKQIVRQKKEAMTIIRDPNEILDELAGEEGMPATGSRAQAIESAELVKRIDAFIQKIENRASEVPNVRESKRKPGRLESEWNKRVFVGGSYSKHYSEINQIKGICMKSGFDPVIAFEFDAPEGMVHHHALMLLHECRLAIFEVTEHVGQLMEIERLRDYQVEPLIVCQEKAPLSEMLEALLKSEGYEIKRYKDPEGLSKLVRDFLGNW